MLRAKQSVITSGPEVKRAQENDVYLRLEIVKKASTGDASKDLEVNYYSRELGDDEDAGICWAVQQVLSRILTDQFAQLQLLPAIKCNRYLYDLK